jgi:hypothetical protein
MLSWNDTRWILYRKISNHDFLICQFYTGLTGISDKISIRYLSISILQFQKLIWYFSILILPIFSISPMPGDYNLVSKNKTQIKYLCICHYLNNSSIWWFLKLWRRSYKVQFMPKFYLARIVMLPILFQVGSI